MNSNTKIFFPFLKVWLYTQFNRSLVDLINFFNKFHLVNKILTLPTKVSLVDKWVPLMHNYVIVASNLVFIWRLCWWATSVYILWAWRPALALINPRDPTHLNFICRERKTSRIFHCLDQVMALPNLNVLLIMNQIYSIGWCMFGAPNLIDIVDNVCVS